MEQNLDEPVPRMGPIRLRQMNLPECYKKIKLSKFKFSAPFNVTVEPIQIDSDSDEEKEKIASDLNLPAETKKEIPDKLKEPKIMTQTQATQIRKRHIFDDIKNNNSKTPTPNVKPRASTSNNTTNIEPKIFSTVTSKKYLQSLLSPKEKEILKKINKLNSNCQIILLKLYSEKCDWHNVYQFCKRNNIKEDKNTVDKFQHLHHQCFIDIRNINMNDMDTYDFLQKLNQKKLKEIIKENKVIKCKKYSNQGMIDSIVFSCTNQRTLTGHSYKDTIMKKIKKKIGFDIQLLPSVYEAIKNIYILETLFNNKIQNVKDYINIITTNITLPKVPLEDYPIFASRDNFLTYTKAKTMQKEFENILNTNLIRPQKISAIKDLGEEIYNELITIDFQDAHPNAPYMNIFTDQFTYIDLLTKCYEKIYTTHVLEGKKWLEYLIDHFPNSKKFGHWNYQLIWLYMRHLEEIDLKSATRLLVQVFSSHSDKLSESDKHNLTYLSLILKSNKTLQINEIFFERISEMAPDPINVSAFLQEEFSSETNVTRKMNKETGFTHLEQVALNHYSKAAYSEGRNCQIIISTLFVAYFWDILYSPSKNPTGVFISELQSAPLDLHDQYFYGNRKLEIDKRLKDIQEKWSSKEFIEFGVANFENNCLYKSCFQLLLPYAGLAVDIPDVDVFRELAEIIGGRVLGQIFQRLVQDLSDSITNMPSLLVWNPMDKSWKFIEVKNARAKTPVEKLLWLRYLQSIGAGVEIFNIRNPSKRNDTTVPKFEESSASEEEEEYEEEEN
ncbi:unnamed protein product [Ceutorhynchus assimilis]|uniref:Fanconi-associated nuclease n=1 Tax=Ceutorhynchus assimilis TaxID=467358 RepID=A0A9N9QEL7_9CUCU|nr:unnamed protein product [Ceutorhynchus assimilis]